MKQTDHLRDTDLTPCTEKRFGPKLLTIISCQPTLAEDQENTGIKSTHNNHGELVIAHMAWAKEKSATIGRAGAKTYIKEMAR